MDYLDQVAVIRHPSWADFERWRRMEGLRLVLFTTKATVSYLDHRYEARDMLLFGRESAGVPDHVHEAAEARLRIPMRAAMRSPHAPMPSTLPGRAALSRTRT